MMVLGLTGNIGSGKSTTAKIFESFGYKIIDADLIAKSLYAKKEVREKVEDILKISILNSDKTINYKLIADKYFNDTNSYKKINVVLYSALKDEFEQIIKESNSKILIDAAMLFEFGFNIYDYIICVSAPQAERFERVKKRNGFSYDEFIQRENRQSTQEWKEKKSDFVINNFSPNSLIEQVNEVLEKIER